jgi:hypothetical protein
MTSHTLLRLWTHDAEGIVCVVLDIAGDATRRYVLSREGLDCATPETRIHLIESAAQSLTEIRPHLTSAVRHLLLASLWPRMELVR